MQKEIKFRAWDNKDKKWLMGYERKNLGGFSLFGECVLLREWSKILDEFLFNRNDKKAEDLIVMQFTGLKDAKGVEIYEGDIMKITDTFHTYNMPVIWDKDAWSFKDDGTYGTLSEWNVTTEIIGNIYKNPDLLTNQ